VCHARLQTIAGVLDLRLEPARALPHLRLVSGRRHEAEHPTTVRADRSTHISCAPRGSARLLRRGPPHAVDHRDIRWSCAEDFRSDGNRRADVSTGGTSMPVPGSRRPAPGLKFCLDIFGPPSLMVDPIARQDTIPLVLRAFRRALDIFPLLEPHGPRPGLPRHQVEVIGGRKRTETDFF